MPGSSQRGPPTLASPRHSNSRDRGGRPTFGTESACRWSLVSFALYSRVIFFRKLSTTSWNFLPHGTDPSRHGCGVTSGRTPPDKPARERSERIGALERGFSSPTRPLIIVVFRHSRRKGNDHAQRTNPANGDIQRRPHSNRGIASRRSGPRSRTSSSKSKPNAAMGRRDPHRRRLQVLGVRDRGTDQPTVGPPDGRGDASRSRRLGEPAQARSLAQGAGHAIKDQGRRDVTLRTTCGQVIVRATYFSRNCDRSKASKGMYPMLLLWGVHDRCTAAIVSEISKLVAMLSSLEEVEQVLSDRGRPLDYKTIRTIAYRFATRARAAQRVGALNWGETVGAVAWSSPPTAAGFGFAGEGVVDEGLVGGLDRLSAVSGVPSWKVTPGPHGDGPLGVVGVGHERLGQVGLPVAARCRRRPSGRRWPARPRCRRCPNGCSTRPG